MNDVADTPKDSWENDKLGYAEIGHAFTNVVQSIDSGKVISIEAGFGRGKTFFRKAWAEQLNRAGEVVVQVDVQQSDHSGDPVITLLGALVDALPKGAKAQRQKALESVKKIGAISARAITRAILREGAEEIFEVISDSAIDQLEDFNALDDFIKGVGGEMSKVAGQLITSQLAAERVRKTELPGQLEALKAALVEDAKTERVVVIIDELDRCHPEYAISFLEATKLIFGRSGFVFCLMINPDYLENLARHRFGVAQDDEKYLDKFVDIRLKLNPQPEAFKTAVYELACMLPLRMPYGESESFTVERAAELASALAVECGLSMRKTKRILLKVEMALRCYSDRPLDAPLLVFMAFKDEYPDLVKESHLPRSFLTPEEGRKHSGQGKNDLARFMDEDKRDYERNKLVNEKAAELLELPPNRYLNPEGRNYKPWARVFIGLAPNYLPSHRKALDGVASVLAT